MTGGIASGHRRVRVSSCTVPPAHRDGSIQFVLREIWPRMTTPPDTERSGRSAPPPESDSDAFARYLGAIATPTSERMPRLGRVELLLGIVLSFATVALAFAPWVAYQNRQEQDAFRRGIEADGLLLIGSGVIAGIALCVAWFRGPGEGSFEVLIGAAANAFGFVAAGFTWMNITSFAIDDYKDPSKIHADWGVMVATLVAAFASVICLRLWWTIRHY